MSWNRDVSFTVAMQLVVALLGPIGQVAMAQSLVPDQRIELPSVQGRIDHLAIDVDGARLFVAAFGADSVEVIDLRSGKRAARIASLHEPQGLAYLPEARRLMVANGAGGGVQAFADARPPAVASASALDDADNLRFDAAAKRLYVGYAKALAIIDPDTLQVIQRIELAGHPESFQLEAKGPRIYVNVPSARHIAVVDRSAGHVTATWELADVSRNFPMALDELSHHLFVATRQPPMLLGYDTRAGKRMAQLAICGDADDLFFDEQRRQLYVVCGEGVVQVVRQQDGERYEVAERVQTSPGARTGLFVPKLATLFIAVPARAGAIAEIRSYRVK